MGRGQYLARLGEERHAALVKLAGERGVSVNQLLCEAADLILTGGDIPSSQAVQAALERISEMARQLARGCVVIPASEGGDDRTWSDIMNGQGHAGT